MMDDVTSDDWFSSAKPGGLISSTTPPSGMTSTAVIAGITVGCVSLVAVGTVLLFCLYRRRRRRKQAGHQNKADERRPKSGHGSSTMRSDKSDHPYENPSLPRKLRADHAAKVAKQLPKPGAGRYSDPYAHLKGQSLPHHYQGLGQEPEPLDDPPYDELMASSEGNNSDYYFKLEAGSRSNTGVQPGVQPAARPAVDPTDPDQAYDLVEVGNMSGNNANRNKDRSNKSNTGKENGANPYYFKVDKLQGGSFTAPASVRNHGNDQPSNNDKPSSSEQGKRRSDKTNAKPSIAMEPNNIITKNLVRERVNSYDKLDRSTLTAPKTEDINANEYDKLVAQLAVQPHNGNSVATSGDGYLKVKIGNGVDDTDVDSFTEVNDYNKLERGVEKEFDNVIVSEYESSTL